MIIISLKHVLVNIAIIIIMSQGFVPKETFWSNYFQKNKGQTQLNKYQSRHSSAFITNFLVGGSAQGARGEAYARSVFPMLGPRQKTDHDHTLMVNNKTFFIEQKTSGIWEEDNFKWQHIEPNHPWDLLLLCGIDFHTVHFWSLSRHDFVELVAQGKIINQGSKNKTSSQGFWFNYKDVKNRLKEIQSQEDLLTVLVQDQEDENLKNIESI
jgi:hypothetical protein